MAKLNVRERVDHVFKFTVPAARSYSEVLQNDQSAIIMEVIVPAFEHAPDAELQIQVGSSGHFSLAMPLRLFTDLYHAAVAGAGRPLRGYDEELGTVLRLAITSWDRFLELTPTNFAELKNVREVITATTELAAAIKELEFRSTLGMRLARAILWPPRQALRVSMTQNASGEVWLRGLMSRDVE